MTEPAAFYLIFCLGLITLSAIWLILSTFHMFYINFQAKNLDQGIVQN